MREQSTEQTQKIFIYIIGTMHGALHFTVGVIWENVSLPVGTSALLSLPYFGGYLTLLGVAVLLIFTYFWLSLKKQPKIPLHIRKFYVTLSIIITVGSLVLFVVMCIRTNDYRLQKDQIAKEAYYGAVLMTVVDILATIFFMPSYIYLLICSYKQVQAMKQPQAGSNQDNQTPGTDRHLHQQHRASIEQPIHQQQQHRQTQPHEDVITISNNGQMNLECDRKGSSQSEPQTEACRISGQVYVGELG